MEQPLENEAFTLNSVEFETYSATFKKEFISIIGEDKVQKWFK